MVSTAPFRIFTTGLWVSVFCSYEHKSIFILAFSSSEQRGAVLCITLHKDRLWQVGRLGIILRRKDWHFETLVYTRGNKGSFCNKADTGLHLKQKKEQQNIKTVFLQCIKIEAGTLYTHKTQKLHNLQLGATLSWSKGEYKHPQDCVFTDARVLVTEQFHCGTCCRTKTGGKSFSQRFPFSQKRL